MRALSFWQPWLVAILQHNKRVENRGRWQYGCRIRGTILLHASLGVGTRDDFNGAVETILQNALPKDQSPVEFTKGWARAGALWGPSGSLHRGGFVGIARITGVIREGMAEDLSQFPDPDQQARWWFGGFALALSDAKALPFVPYRGEQGFFDVPESKLPTSYRAAIASHACL